MCTMDILPFIKCVFQNIAWSQYDAGLSHPDMDKQP